MNPATPAAPNSQPRPVSSALSRRSLTAAAIVFVALLGCKKIKDMVGGGESKCPDVAACKTACDGDDAKACVKLGDLHRKKPHGADGKWDPDAVDAAYDKACTAGNQQGCAQWASMKAYKSEKAYQRAKGACEKGIDLGCAVAGSILAGGREYSDGNVAKDEAKARADLEGRCQKEMPACCSALGYSYYWGSDASEKEKAPALFRKACDGGSLSGCFYQAAFIEKDDDAKLKLLAKVCDEGPAGGEVSADNSCRVEAEAHVKWLTTKLLKAYVAAGKPSPGSSEAQAFRDGLKSDQAYQDRKARLLKIAPHACNMGSSDACKLMTDNPKWFEEKPY
jgi:hypothetical protein